MKSQKKENQRLRTARHNNCLDFHRSIHEELDDGALLAICESYGDEEETEPREETD